MRDIENIDGELRLLARAWRVARELCDRMPRRYGGWGLRSHVIVGCRQGGPGR